MTLYNLSLQRLCFMRSDTTINKKQVLVVYLGAVEEQITHSIRDINKALQDAPAFGLSSTGGYIREFLLPSAPSCVIRKGSPHIKRLRVTAFYHSAIPMELRGVLLSTACTSRIMYSFGPVQ